MKIGGYQIIDLQNKPLSGVGMQYEGLYEKIEGTKKPILLSGLNVDGTEYHDAFVNINVDGGNFVLTYPIFTGELSSIIITIEDTNVVTASIQS